MSCLSLPADQVVASPGGSLRAGARVWLGPFPPRMGVTYPAIQPRPPCRQHVLAEPGGAPAAPPPGGGVDNLQVRAAHDPVHAEGGRLPRLARLGVTHACQGRWGKAALIFLAPHRAPPRAAPGKRSLCVSGRRYSHAHGPPFSSSGPASSRVTRRVGAANRAGPWWPPQVHGVAAPASTF